MIKQIKNILISPLFMITFIVSFIVIILNGISYINNTSRYTNQYDIVYSEDIVDYDKEIENLRIILDELSPKTENYDDIKTHYENEILIYEELKNNNIKYDEIYDFGYGNDSESFLYLLNSESPFIIIMIVNIIVLIYLSFNTDFDNSRYTVYFG